MKKQIGITATALAALAMMPLVASAQTATTSFGTVPAGAYSGSGIPNTTSEITTISSGGSLSDSITLAMSTTQYKANPAPGNNGAGTYYVNTGLNPLIGDRSVWNFDFYISDTGGNLGNDGVTYALIEYNVGNGETFNFDPTSIPDNLPHSPASSAGNSESLDFNPFGTVIGYDANLNDTYDFTLEALLGGNVIGSSDISVVAGTGAPVPEASTWMSGALMLLPFGIGGLRAIRRKQANA